MEWQYQWCGESSVIVIDPNDSVSIIKNFESIKNRIVMFKSRDTLLHAHPFMPYASRYSDSAIQKIKDPYMIKSEEIGFINKWQSNQRKVMEKLKKAGALAVIVKAPGSDGTAFVDGQYNYRKDVQPTISEIAVSSEDYLKLMRLIKSTGNVELEIDVKTKFDTQDTQGYNVIAEIPGTDPTLKSELVMLGAHLDSWHSGTGATDNAAGCAVMMEAVRIIKALKLQPKRTIRIALWSGEEQALLGSIGYVKNHFGDPATMALKAEHSKISAYYNLDNGTGKIRGVFLQNNEAVAPIFKSWLYPFADLGAYNLNTTNTGGTDHLSFDAVGIPGFQFIQDPIEYDTRTHHSNMDTYDHLILEDLKHKQQQS
jgi:hypothetical protein